MHILYFAQESWMKWNQMITAGQILGFHSHYKGFYGWRVFGWTCQLYIDDFLSQFVYHSGNVSIFREYVEKNDFQEGPKP
jgi:exosortase/archaeosortase